MNPQDGLLELLNQYAEPVSQEEYDDIREEAAKRAARRFEAKVGVPADTEAMARKAGTSLERLAEATELAHILNPRSPDGTVHIETRRSRPIPSKQKVLIAELGAFQDLRYKLLDYRIEAEWEIARERGYYHLPADIGRDTHLAAPLYRFKPDTPSRVLEQFGIGPNLLAVSTHPFTGPMRRILLDQRKEWLTEEVNVREGRQLQKRQVRARLELHKNVEFAQAPEEILQHVLKKLLKSRDTSLLKVHMDLTHQAFIAKSSQPEIIYDLNQAAERLGLERQSHGSYHTDSLRGIYERILALTLHYVDVYKMKDKRRGEQVFDAPFWIINYRGRAEAGELLDGHPLLLDRPDIIKTLVLEPGGWWRAAGMSEGYYFHLPAELLKLTTDSRSETNHMAVRIAAELAVWERINNNKKAIKPVVREVGKLLEQAGVTTYAEISGKHRKQQKRLREYLAGTESEGKGQTLRAVGGALGLLRDYGAFDIEIQDEAAFWASGRGWFKSFWGSRIKLSVRPYQKRLDTQT